MYKTYLYGGVGNQLFQYFLLYVQSEKFEVSELFLENYRTQSSHVNALLNINQSHRPSYSRTIFQTSIKSIKRLMIKVCCALNLSSIIGIKTDKSQILFDIPDCAFFGYWHDLKLFEPYRDIIKNADWIHDSQFLNSNNRCAALSERTCVIHIRKGDYLLGKNKKIFSDLNAQFYINGLSQLNEKFDNLIICTDDRKWVEDNLLKDILPIFQKVEMSSAYGCSSWVDDFLLMRFAQNLIMSNSTFSWWAAFLNDNNVYYPRRWYLESDFSMKRKSWKYFGALE